MEAEFLGFEEVPALEDDEQRKLVPWLDWNEWLSVRDALFSHSSQSLSFALKRISSWRSRGSLPAAIDVTATIVEIQNMDPFFRQDKLDDGSVSEEILSNLYTMAIVRLVNATVEKIGTKEQGSINVRADKICIPRMLIDVRHEGSHRELPSLNVARSASVKALDWLKSYYWEPQSEAIPFQGKGNADVKKEIKSTIRKLAICVKVSGSPQSSTLLKGKLPKKQIKRILKSVIRLHSSFSSETVSVLLDYLLKTLSSSEFKKNVDDASVGPTIENVLADWKPVILKLYNKEPELHLNLLKEVLHKIEAQEDMKCEEDNSSQGFYQSAYLSSLFAWLVRIHDKKTSVANMPKRVMHELVRKCILISRLCNKQIMDSALHLAKLMDDKSLLKKVQLLSGLALSNIVDNADDQNSSLTSTNVSQFEESLREANKKLELVKQQITRNKQSSEMNCETEETQVWTLAKSWNPCPIGMLPHFIGSSGCLPVLDVIDNETVLDVIDNEEHNQVPASKGNWKLIKHGAKRDAPSDIQLLDNSTAKKMRETEEPGELNSETPTEEDELPTEEGKGYLIVGGIWKKVTEEELLAIQSSVRILI
ncbi:pre-rRNA-processing protein las1 [Trifolium pratense]|uniref:pre-rRNA-processing protein las1 n=1 Tax=Trifolium pratense TaxID=57577 RepID=UPI001E6912B8|nr:pre-rRNA-processing protein las1 [Trifolium pratense]